MGWARADGELRAEPPWDRIDRNRGAGRLARRGVRHETRDASGDMRPRDVRQVAAFSPLTSHVSRPAHHLGRPDRAAGQARKARRAGPEPSRQESRVPSIPRSSGARSSPSRWSWWSRWSRAATRLEPPLKGSGRGAPDMCLAAADLVALWHTSLRLRSQNGTTGTTKTTETARVDRDGRFGPPRPPSAKLTPPPGRRRRSLRAGTRA